MSVSADLEACRVAAKAEGEVVRNPYIVFERLTQLYNSLSPSERMEANRVLAEWLTSPDDTIWHIAFVLISQLHIVSAIPDLIALARRFRTSTRPGSPQWAATVDKVADKLLAESQERRQDGGTSNVRNSTSE